MAEKKIKILVIDDEPDALELLKTRLESRGYAVWLASGAPEAIKQAEKQPDIILLDLLIPAEKDGLGLFLALKTGAFTRDTPVIFLTGKAGENTRLTSLGASACVEKPYEAENLFEKIDSVLRK